MAADVARFKREIAGRKAYVVGEFGFVPVAEMRTVLDTVIRENVSGAMAWSLRFHNRDGGFYWHSEPSGAGLYKAFHYPGFASGEPYEERAVFDLLRAKAFEIRAETLPPFERPAPPKLLPVESPARISWQGSAGATSYQIERAERPEGPWTVVGLDVDDTRVQYRPLFSDVYAEAGRRYYYRVRANSPGGQSAPSSIVGPVRLTSEFVVDELVDKSKLLAYDERLAFVTNDARAYKEDAHRLAGGEGSWAVYRTRTPLVAAEVLAFMANDAARLAFLSSVDGTTWKRIEARVERLAYGANPYGYRLPVRYRLASFGGARFLKIEFEGACQIGRVELQHALGATR
jgi:mannan endo-1,4-beta-mannosidase